MKNTFLVLALALVTVFTAQAQELPASTASDLKPVTGDKTAEVGFNFNSGTFLSGGQLRFHKFTSDNKALRLSANAYFKDDAAPAKEVTATYGFLTVSPGIERHFEGTKRLSPYIGAELPLTFAHSRYEDPEKTIKGGWHEGNGNYGHVGIGVNALAGVDVYLIKNLYLGIEFGAGISYKDNQKVKVDFKEDNLPDYTFDGDNTISFDTFTRGFRIGFVF